MIIKPLCTVIALSMACAFTSVVNAKETTQTIQQAKVENIANSQYSVDPAKIERLSNVKKSLGISGLSDHTIKAQYGTELNAEIVAKIKTKLATLKAIEDKYAFLMAVNSVMKTDHLHLNSNFPMDWSVEDKKLLDAVYTAYVGLVYSKNQGATQAEIKNTIQQLERQAPFKLYDADLKKARAFFNK